VVKQFLNLANQVDEDALRIKTEVGEVIREIGEGVVHAELEFLPTWR
jgi:hypothetical protein